MCGIFVGILMTVIDLLGQWFFFLTWEFTFEFSFFFFSSSHEHAQPWDACHVQHFLVVRKHHTLFLPQLALSTLVDFTRSHLSQLDGLPFVKRRVALTETGSRHGYLGSSGDACQRTGAKMGPPDEYFSFSHHRAHAFNTHSLPAVEKHTHFQGWVPSSFCREVKEWALGAWLIKEVKVYLASRIGKTSETTEGFPRAGMSWESLTARAGGLVTSAGEHPGSHVSLLEHSKPYPMVWWLGMISFWDVVVEVG